MSKHEGRQERWVEVSPTRFNHMHGYVQCNSYGLWEAILVYRQRPPLPRKGQPKKDNRDFIETLRKLNLPEHLLPKVEEGRPWRRATKHCGEHKRARQAMMALEAAVKKFMTEKDPDKLL